MKVDKYNKKAIFKGEDGETMAVRYDNRGEPYREGINLELYDGTNDVGVFLEDREAKQLRDLLNKLYPKATK